MALVYLDSAATSLWRPVEVAEAVARSVMLHAGYGRNQSASSDAASTEVYRCRELLAGIFNVKDPADIVFCFNATHALNTAIFGLYEKGRPCLISGYEHNAVRRPILELERRGETELAVFESRLFDREDAVRSLRAAMEEKRPGLVVCTAVGNVFGNIMPVEEIGGICREFETSFIVDASQGAGIIPLDMQKIGADAMCMPGHKGLMGPVGTGVMILGQRKPRPFLFGGTGIASEEAGQPETSPERYESGTLNICGISGLAAALEYIGRNWDHLHGRKRQLCEIISDIIGAGGMRVFGPEKNFESGIFSFDPGFDSEIAAGMLGSRGIAVRGGLHCSPLAHRSVGTAERGTVRISPQSNLSFRCARKTAEQIVKVLAMTGQ